MKMGASGKQEAGRESGNIYVVSSARDVLSVSYPYVQSGAGD